MVALGAVLSLAAKLQYPQVGGGGSPIDALSASVIAGLGSLRVPIHLGGLTASALPLGALFFIGWAAVWALNRASDPHDSLSERVREGLKLGLWLGPTCALLALIFRIRGETTFGADFWWSLLLGASWGALFGAIGALRSWGPPRDIARRAAEIFGGEGERREGFRIASTILGALAIAAVVMILVGLIAALLSGRPKGEFGIGDALAGVVYLIAFGPNLVIAVLALAFGSSISLGAQITAGGRQVGPLQELSFFDWPPGGPPGWAFVLVLLPLGATVFAGIRSHRRIADRPSLLRALGWAASALAVILFTWAALAEARLGAGLLDRRGFARLAPDPWILALAAVIWTFIGGTIGWYVATGRARDKPG